MQSRLTLPCSLSAFLQGHSLSWVTTEGAPADWSADTASNSFPSGNDHARVAGMDPARRRATYEDLLQVSDLLIAEIIDGELITSPRPAFPHAHAASAITQDLSPFARRPGGPGGPGGWWVLFAPELHLGADILVPDVAGWRRERMPILGNIPYCEQAPDWVCEVVSPSTGRLDRV